jgi:hypothetical protein
VSGVLLLVPQNYPHYNQSHFGGTPGPRLSSKSSTSMKSSVQPQLCNRSVLSHLSRQGVIQQLWFRLCLFVSFPFHHHHCHLRLCFPYLRVPVLFRVNSAPRLGVSHPVSLVLSVCWPFPPPIGGPHWGLCQSHKKLSRTQPSYCRRGPFYPVLVSR